MEKDPSNPTTGTKRSWEGIPLHSNLSTLQSSTATSNMGESSPNMLSMFGSFCDELDSHHDRRERLIKISRDITALSKKIIFSLQRVRTSGTPIPASITKDTQPRLTQINELFLSAIPDITSLNGYRYLRQISPGIQEFIEALSFKHYLETQSLITLSEVKTHLPPQILITEEDYMMGLFDLTGELMRFAVTSLSAGSHTDSISEEGNGENEGEPRLPTLLPAQAGVVRDLREIRAEFESITIPRRGNMLRDYWKKSEVMQASVEKVERAAYGILVRGSERPKGWKPDLSAGVEMEIY
ncbi:Translin family-domain-containing protein [Aspergillus cavernicola]|uniref:Translin family-domain-containing protein n=1 Tax=Aspergillus cavernicola TaxID=176166 RepID=A0ABR4I6Z1_9EURO